MSSPTVRSKNQHVTAFTDALFDIPEIPRSSSHQTRHLNDLRDSVVKSAQLEGYAVGIEQGRTEGYSIGVAEGEAQALIEAERERSLMLDQFSQELTIVMAQAKAALPAWCEMAEQALTDRVSEVCRGILLRELELDRSSIVEMVREAMTHVSHARTVRLLVNPLDEHVVMQYRDELRAAANAVEDVEIVADHSIAGGCIIETDGGTVGGSIDAKLEVFDRLLTEEAA